MNRKQFSKKFHDGSQSKINYIKKMYLLLARSIKVCKKYSFFHIFNLTTISFIPWKETFLLEQFINLNSNHCNYGESSNTAF